jgi:thiol-disulfide isomerase/thioredoxin
MMSRAISIWTAAALLNAGLMVDPLAAQSPAATPKPPSLAAGEVVASFDAQAVEGGVRHVDFGPGTTTVVLFFLSSCPVCHRMIPLWNDFYERKTKGLTVVGVMLDREPPGFFTATRIAFPVVRSPGPALNQAFKVHHVPMTVRVGPGGRVQDVGEGQIDAIRLGEIFRPPAPGSARRN